VGGAGDDAPLGLCEFVFLAHVEYLSIAEPFLKLVG